MKELLKLLLVPLLSHLLYSTVDLILSLHNCSRRQGVAVFQDVETPSPLGGFNVP